jgi:hypothetical protein
LPRTGGTSFSIAPTLNGQPFLGELLLSIHCSSELYLHYQDKYDLSTRIFRGAIIANLARKRLVEPYTPVLSNYVYNVVMHIVTQL